MRSSNTSKHKSNNWGKHIINSKIKMMHIRFIIYDSRPILHEYCVQLGYSGLGYFLFRKWKAFPDILLIPS